MDWERDLPGWSLPELSQRITCGNVRWHAQIAGSGSDLLLLPGAGASTHTWAALIPELAKSHRVIAIDLPGQGFSQSNDAKRAGLDDMVTDIETLLSDQSWSPQAIIGHSAGAAVALRLSINLNIGKVIGINPALDNFKGMAGWLFPILARVLAANPFTANLFAFGANEKRAQRLIEGTGSHIDDQALSYYTRLIGDRAHVNGALQMMARWSLDELVADLPKVTARVLFLTGANDLAVPPEVAARAAKAIPHAQVIEMPRLGHLAHEEDPTRVLTEINRFLAV